MQLSVIDEYELEQSININDNKDNLDEINNMKFSTLSGFKDKWLKLNYYKKIK